MQRKFALMVWFSALTLSFLSGCAAVGPNYVPPKAEVETRFIGGGSSALFDAARDEWWQSLSEPLLNAVVAKGLSQNLSIAASLERIEAARAQLRQAGWRSQVSGGVSGQSTRADNGAGPKNNSTVGADSSYVFDLFGGVRRNIEQGQASVGAAEFDAGTVRLGFIAEVVSSYIQARFFQNAAEISRQTIASRRRTLDLVRLRVDAGDATSLELQQAQQALDQTISELPLLLSNFEISTFRIATLLAEPAAPILSRLQLGSGLPTPNGTGNLGVPADLIRNRPDIRAAERNLAAATAAIGVSEAQLYPSLVISGSISQTTDLSSSSSPSLRTWGFGPALSIPVLNRGILIARRDVAISQAKQAELEWKNAVLAGVEDVQTYLSQTQGLSRQVSSIRRVTESSERVLSLSRTSYESGATPITDVIDAELALSNSRVSLLSARRDLALSWVKLQIAAGKGWVGE